MDLISRQAAIDCMNKVLMFRMKPELKDRVAEYLKSLPSAEPERKTGIWILSDIQNKEDNDNGNYAYICSNCFHRDIHAKTAVVPYCWYCGAKMEKGEKE